MSDAIVNRRTLLLAAAAHTVTRSAAAQPTPQSPAPFDAGTVRRAAAALARQSFTPADTKLPPAIDRVTYDQYGGIRFKPDRGLWAGQNLPFTAEFFPRAALYRARVDIFVVTAGQATPVPYSPDNFDYADPALRVPDAIGYAGLRLRTPMNRPDAYDEVAVFLGASYFRAGGRNQIYGLSARGLAIGTGNPRGEEFSRFTTFWLETPQPGVNAIVVHALLDSPSTTGAYRFTIRPGTAAAETTIFDVETVLYPRTDIAEPGIAPLTSMYQFGTKDSRRFDDWRPAVHDSDGLVITNGRREQLWRPLSNPADLQISAFTDTSPHGFGLLQRSRTFAGYQDLQVSYERRPSLWVEPIGDWGQGAVDLVEIPTPNETNDNIVAFWRPREPLAAKGEYPFTYRLHWGNDRPNPGPLARVIATREGAGEQPGTRVFVIDFEGPSLKGVAPEATRVDFSNSAGSLGTVFSIPNSETGGWRISFNMDPGGAKLVEMHCYLVQTAPAGGQPLTETWIYRWTP